MYGVIQTHDHSVWAGEDSSYLRLYGHCDLHNPLTKLRGLSPLANYTDRAPLVGEVSANFCW
jgi:hypothetical protein